MEKILKLIKELSTLLPDVSENTYLHIHDVKEEQWKMLVKEYEPQQLTISKSAITVFHGKMMVCFYQEENSTQRTNY